MKRTDERAVLYFFNKGGIEMKIRYFPSTLYKVIPIQSDDGKHEENDKKLIINQLSRMNEDFIRKGAGRKVGQEYRDVPHFSLKLLKKNGKIHAFMNIPKDTNQSLKTKITKTLYLDIGDYRIQEDHLDLNQKNMHVFAVKGEHYLAIDLEQPNRIKDVFKLANEMMISVTVKETENHEEKRKKLKNAMLGLTDWKKKTWHYAKVGTRLVAEELIDFFEEETKEKLKKHMKKFQQKTEEEDATPFTKRKLTSEKNRFMCVEILIFVWTDQAKAQKFQEALQKTMSEIQGENKLKIVEVKPDLNKVIKGRIQYDLPNLCLYQTELDKFLLLPNAEDNDFYSEIPQKTVIPERMFLKQKGALAFARELYTDRVLYMPRPRNSMELDDRIKATIAIGEQGSGKTSLIENQIIETYLGNVDNERDWKKYGRSVIAFELADGEMIRNIYQRIPKFARNNVIILNHADVENPLYVGFQDLIKINKNSRSIKKQIADIETKILLDSMEDDSKTVAVERYFKTALRASYEVGKGNLLDALDILKDQAYLAEVLKRLQTTNKNLAKVLSENAIDMQDDKKVLPTIKNRLVPFMTDDDFTNMIAQQPNDRIDFWKWTNTGPYLVLIYLPGSGQEISQELRKFLFAHYFMKIWLTMLARERIEKEKRKECLVVVDELHQILDQRVVQNRFGALFKEPRKYRFRFLFSIHGESSFNEAGRAKDRLIRAIEDARPNLLILKHGGDFFKKMSGLLKPYSLQDFTQLMNMEYCGIFRIDLEKKAQTFMAKLLEPLDQRFPMEKEISLEEFRLMKNALGRPREEVERKIHNLEEEKTCLHQQQPQEKTLDEELAELV
jgi:hypothetical protein